MQGIGPQLLEPTPEGIRPIERDPGLGRATVGRDGPLFSQIASYDLGQQSVNDHVAPIDLGDERREALRSPRHRPGPPIDGSALLGIGLVYHSIFTRPVWPSDTANNVA